MTAGIETAAHECPPDGNQITRYPLLSHQRGKMIRRVPLANCGEVDKQIGNIFLQVLLPILIQYAQMVQSSARARIVNLSLTRYRLRLFRWPKAP
ncbi:hypothetical protein D3C80_2025750 [compost metagenome]